MIVVINKKRAINSIWVTSVILNSDNTVSVWSGRPGGTAGLSEAKSDYNFEQTIELLND